MFRLLFSSALILGTSMFAQGQAGVSHELFDDLLQKYVDQDGLVNYKGIQSQRAKLKNYLTMLEANPPKDNWTKNEELAYWINAYNAFTIELILRHYPVASIKDIGSSIQIPFVNTPWDVKFINIGDEEYDLNNIEHGIIRKQFDEPRIHFALVCAALSCPKLQNRAYLPSTLEEQLTQATKQFLRNEKKNQFISSNKAKVSKIFNWYGGDFKKDGTLVDYLNKYAPAKLTKNATIYWQDYDWTLNEQQ
ncbi:MAG: DUF547 domain-containing protein [Bacteroidota bacterium]